MTVSSAELAVMTLRAIIFEQVSLDLNRHIYSKEKLFRSTSDGFA